jgi:hypothetical protein
MTQFISLLTSLLPCEMCREHAMRFLELNSNAIPECVKTRLSLFTFFWFYHNDVNERLGKARMTLSAAQVLHNYED